MGPPGKVRGKGKGQDCENALLGGPIPDRLAPLPGPDEPSSTIEGKWEIVIHTFGMKHLEKSGAHLGDRYLMPVQQFLALAPGLRKGPMPGCITEADYEARGSAVIAGAPGAVPLGFDAYLHFGRGSPYELSDAEERPQR